MEKLMKEWKERLGLHDWNVVLKTNCRPDEFERPGRAGEVALCESNKAAKIKLIAEEFYDDPVTPYSAEKILVHELMHLKLSLLDDSGNMVQDRYVHQLVDDLARAMIDAKRGERTCFWEENNEESKQKESMREM